MQFTRPIRLMASPGSLRAKSLNRQVARSLQGLAPPGVAVILYEGAGELPLPRGLRTTPIRAAAIVPKPKPETWRGAARLSRSAALATSVSVAHWKAWNAPGDVQLDGHAASRKSLGVGQVLLE
jgi:hypothetical protein